MLRWPQATQLEQPGVVRTWLIPGSCLPDCVTALSWEDRQRHQAYPTLPCLAFTTALVTHGLLSPFNISILPPQEHTWAIKMVICGIPLLGEFQV